MSEETVYSANPGKQLVRTVDGVRYVNDSKATNVNSCWYALESMTTPVVLILGGKDKGVAAMMAHYGWTVDQCIVFGDGGNDVSMLAACPSSVAMGNGRQEAKDAASFVTKDIDEGGVAWALEHFGVL